MIGTYDLPYRKEERVEKFFIIFVQHTDGGRHYKHTSLESAEKEAERLSRLPENQGKYVYVFEVVGRCRVEKPLVKWEVVEY